MWDEDWARLGIEPTTELAAIKKAYALKLKVTRPDDDAQAYQALRGAYERAQQWIRDGAPRAEHDEIAEPPEPAPSLAPSPAPDEHQEPTPAEPTAPEPESAREAVQQLNQLWVDHGGAALLAEWPALRARLDAQPLARRAEWSAHFAHWVVHQEGLPDAFVFALDDHFGWQQDFRVERQIGPELAQAVQQALQARRAEEAHPSAEVQEAVKPLQQLGRLLGQRALALWLAFLVQPGLARLLGALHPRTLGQCGVDPGMRQQLEKLLRTGWLLRVALVGGAVAALFLFVSDDRDLATTRLMAWAGLGGLGLGACHYLGLFMHFGLSLQRPGQAPLALPLQRWRRHRWQPLAGLGVLGAAIALAAAVHDLDLLGLAPGLSVDARTALMFARDLVPWCLLLAGAALAWPLTPVASPACIGLLFPVAGALFSWASPGDPWAAVMAAAVLYVLTGAARFEARVGGNVVLDAVCRPVTNTLALAQRWGWQFAMLPSLLTLAYLFMFRPAPATSRMILPWVATTLLLSQLQHRAETWALARLNRA